MVLICQQGLIPHRTKFLGVSFRSRGRKLPVDKNSSGYQTRSTKLIGVSDPAEQSSLGYWTARNRFKTVLSDSTQIHQICVRLIRLSYKSDSCQIHQIQVRLRSCVSTGTGHVSMCRGPCIHMQGIVFPLTGDRVFSCRMPCIHMQGTVYPCAGARVSMCGRPCIHVYPWGTVYTRAGDCVSTCKGTIYLRAFCCVCIYDCSGPCEAGVVMSS